MVKILYKNYKIIYEENIYSIEHNMERNVLEPEPAKYKFNFGKPIWILLHTLALKVKDDIFYSFKNDLLNIIFYICKNIVCDKCANHAVDYLNKIDFLNIETKEDLIYKLFYFHNELSKELIEKYNLKLDLFLYENLESTYRNRDTQTAIQDILKYDFYVKQYYFKNEDVILYLTKWFSDNFYNFDH
jgi:hypothetical protein